MPDINTVPKVVTIEHYAGDTLNLQVTIPAGFADGYIWTGQIRQTRETGSAVDAEFIITPPGTPGDPGYVMLTAADSERLARSGVLSQKRTSAGLRTVITYRGEYDVQVAPPVLEDPVTSLFQGTITIELDVTREQP